MAKETKSLKTVSVKVRFWTNGLPNRVGTKNELIPCWSNGVAIVEANKEKGIKAETEIFYSPEDIPRAIQKLLAKSNIAIVTDQGHDARSKKRLTK